MVVPRQWSSLGRYQHRTTVGGLHSGALHHQLGRAVAPQLLRPCWARHMQWFATKNGVLAEVLGLDVYWVRFPADLVNLLSAKLVWVESAEEKKSLHGWPRGV
jgi:hypothetical protein